MPALDMFSPSMPILTDARGLAVAVGWATFGAAAAGAAEGVDGLVSAGAAALPQAASKLDIPRARMRHQRVMAFTSCQACLMLAHLPILPEMWDRRRDVCLRRTSTRWRQARWPSSVTWRLSATIPRPSRNS